MAKVQELKINKVDAKSKQALIEDLKSIIERVENDEIELLACSTLDVNGDIAGYHARLRKANLLELLGLIEILSDYLKGKAYEE
jgi:hypothetical protein